MGWVPEILDRPRLDHDLVGGSAVLGEDELRVRVPVDGVGPGGVGRGPVDGVGAGVPGVGWWLGCRAAGIGSCEGGADDGEEEEREEFSVDVGGGEGCHLPEERQYGMMQVMCESCMCNNEGRRWIKRVMRKSPSVRRKDA